MKKYIRALVILISLQMMLAACDGSDEGKQDGNVPYDDRLVIATSFYPVYISVINVANNVPGARIVNVTQPQTGCLHDYNLNPGDLKLLQQADILIINGAGMESFMDKIAAQLPDLVIIDASEGIPLIKDKYGSKTNPHVWVSVSNDILQVGNIAKGLAVADPSYASEYLDNAEEYIGRLETLKKNMHEKLDRLKNRNIVTFHEAFDYFAAEFDLNITAVVEREPGSEPSAGELADTIETVIKTGTKVIFAEPQYSSKSAETIAMQTGASVYILDPVTTGTDELDKDDYINRMEKNLEVLETALSY